MNVDALARIAVELRTLGRWAKLTIAECDAAVHRIYPLGPTLGPFIGGGDTDFAPVFDASSRARYDGIVYFTDGKGALPDESTLPTLWVVTHDDPFEPAFGRIVRLTES